MPTDPSVNPLFQFVPYILIFLIFYFLVIKPQKDKQKQQDTLRKNLKKNDQVITAGGIHGSVVSVKDKTVIVRISDSTKIELDKESVSTVIQKS